MYFQCPPDEDVDGWTEEMIWDELQKPGSTARTDSSSSAGRIFDKMVLRFRSYVCEPLRYGNLFLAGDAGHTVPPTGAKGLNLAFADVRVLFEGIDSCGIDRVARAARRLQRPCAATDLEGAELLVLDDQHAAQPARHQPVRAQAAAR